MEPININVSVELTVSEQLKEIIRGAFARKVANAPVSDAKAERTDNRAAETAKAPETAAKAAAEDIPDADLREAVKAAKNRTNAKTVLGVFREFGIETSSECPQERRADLLAALAKLGEE